MSKTNEAESLSEQIVKLKVSIHEYMPFLLIPLFISFYSPRQNRQVQGRFQEAVLQLMSTRDKIQDLHESLSASIATLENNDLQDIDLCVNYLRETLKDDVPSASMQELAHLMMQKCATDDSNCITLSWQKKHARA